MNEEVLRQIADWKLEAKLEDINRYFFPIPHVNYVENGSRCYVIGRKGTGKTAICEYIDNYSDANTFAQKLTFKNFPFKELYQLQNDSYSSPNQYITLWKYIIYSSIAKMMMKNNNIDVELRTRLERVYGGDPTRSLARTISKWTGRSFELSVLATGGAINLTQETTENDLPWIDRVEILEDFIEKNIDDASYFVVFDELDEDYRDITAIQSTQYTALLTSLFKAVQDVKSIFPNREFNIFPVIFLRDDIYGVLKDPDKTKWSDLGLNLDWNIERIKRMLAFRISRAIDPEGVILTFDQAWNRIFANQPVAFGADQRKGINAFNYITRSTHIRPRDYIRYIQACAENVLLQERDLIDPDTIKKVNKDFSNYLRSEIEDELHGFLPEAAQILDIIAHIRKPVFQFKEFLVMYRREVSRGLVPDKNAELVLQLLFHFSVIGNQPRQKNTQVFKYQNRAARINLSEGICVHPGLFKAMQIL